MAFAWNGGGKFRVGLSVGLHEKIVSSLGEFLFPDQKRLSVPADAISQEAAQIDPFVVLSFRDQGNGLGVRAPQFRFPR